MCNVGYEPSSSDDDEQEDADMQVEDEATADGAPDAVPITTHQQDQPAAMQQGPVIDEDGFQTVQKVTRRRAVRTH